MSELKTDVQELMFMLLGLAIVVFVVLVVIKASWLVLCRAWGNAFEGMADQGDDWSPFPWSGKPERTSIWVIPQRTPLIEIIVDPSRPAWHSAVGVELAGREVGA